MTPPSHPAFFGYGSLVNRATHDHAPAALARLSGWRRVWCATDLRPFAYLSVEPAATEIDGLIAAVPDGDWAALDRREAAYDRRSVGPDSLPHRPVWAADIALYTVRAPRPAAASAPILRSYLDVVLQGFLREFGEAGVSSFLASTIGWEAGLHDDRAAPVYPRAQRLGIRETALIDRHLADHGVMPR